MQLITTTAQRYKQMVAAEQSREQRKFSAFLKQMEDAQHGNPQSTIKTWSVCQKMRYHLLSNTQYALTTDDISHIERIPNWEWDISAQDLRMIQSKYAAYTFNHS